jgi:hypothetical protein
VVIESTTDIDADTELLLDYHWTLSAYFGSCSCKECLKECGDKLASMQKAWLENRRAKGKEDVYREEE